MSKEFGTYARFSLSSTKQKWKMFIKYLNPVSRQLEEIENTKVKTKRVKIYVKDRKH